MCTKDIFEENFFETVLIFYSFLTLSVIFTAGFAKLHSTCPDEHFGEKYIFGKKYVFFCIFRI